MALFLHDLWPDFVVFHAPVASKGQKHGTKALEEMSENAAYMKNEA